MVNVRVLPIVVLAGGAMLALKLTGVASGDGWALRFNVAEARSAVDPFYRPVVSAGSSVPMLALAETESVPAPHDRAISGLADMALPDPLVTGSVPGVEKNDAAEPAASDGGTAAAMDAGEPEALPVPAGDVMPSAPRDALEDLIRERVSPGERAVLEKLQERRQEIEALAKDIEMRESLLQAAEARVEARIRELQELESRIEATVKAEAEQDSGPRIKDLVVMYENMRPKDAAKIFDTLNLRVLVDVSKQMNPRKLSEIMAKMTPEAAQRLTIELAGRPAQTTAAALPPAITPATQNSLPRIQGRPAQP